MTEERQRYSKGLGGIEGAGRSLDYDEQRRFLPPSIPGLHLLQCTTMDASEKDVNWWNELHIRPPNVFLGNMEFEEVLGEESWLTHLVWRDVSEAADFGVACAIAVFIIATTIISAKLRLHVIFMLIQLLRSVVFVSKADMKIYLENCKRGCQEARGKPRRLCSKGWAGKINRTRSDYYKIRAWFNARLVMVRNASKLGD